MLGGELSPDAQADETKLIHVLDISMYFLFVISFGQPPILKIQSTSTIRNPTPALSIPNLCGSRQRVPLRESNHISRHLLGRMLPLFLPQKNVSRRKAMVAEVQRCVI